MNNRDNKSVSGHNSSKVIPQNPFHFSLVICIVGLFTIISMIYGSYLGYHMLVKYTPLVDAAMEIKLEATTAHLWFEEIVNGDRCQNIVQVRQHIDQAQWYATAMLEGGKNTEGTFIPLKDPALRSEIETVFKKIDIFREITEQRFASMQESGTASQIDQRYDMIFKDFINQADRVESELQAEIISQTHIFKIIQITLITASFLLLSATVMFFHRFERRRSLDMQLVNEANKNLQKALEEVKTLQGIIPICCYCKKIRDEKGLWNQLEDYIHEHSEADFSHGVCPDCYKKQIKDIEKGN